MNDVGAGRTIFFITPDRENDTFGSLRLATGNYALACRALGYRTELIPFASIDIAQIYRMRGPDAAAIVSLGGWCNMIEGKSGGAAVSFADAVDKPIIQMWGDNPCGHWFEGIARRDHPQMTTAVIDPDFLSLWSRWTPALGRRTTYVPACPNVSPAPDHERDIACVVVASVPMTTPIREMVSSLGLRKEASVLFDALVDIGMENPMLPLSVIYDAVSSKINIHIDFQDVKSRKILWLADQYVRISRRRMMLNRLAVRPITLIGRAEGVFLHPDSRILPSVDHKELLGLYRRARCVASTPPYAGGVTERFTHPMAAGAVVVSPPTIQSDRLLGRDRLFATVKWDWSDVREVLERLDDPRRRRDIAQAAHDHAKTSFSAETVMAGLLTGKLDYRPYEPA